MVKKMDDWLAKTSVSIGITGRDNVITQHCNDYLSYSHSTSREYIFGVVKTATKFNLIYLFTCNN